MADPFTVSIAASGLFFTALTAVANISSACSAHNANRRRNEVLLETGQVSDHRRHHTAHHQGYSIMPSPDFHLVPHNNGHHTGCGHMMPHSPSPPTHRLEGWVSLEREQQSRDTLKDTILGMHTGRRPHGYDQEMAERHWSYFQRGEMDVPPTIVVVNWSESLVIMYEYSQQRRLYFRNYHVVLLERDLDTFAVQYQSRQVFSGVMKDSWLEQINSYLIKVPRPWWKTMLSVKSSNSWRMLGIQGDIEGDLVFMEMKRAALFGLIESRFKDPTLVNVDMLGHKSQQFVKVDTEHTNLETKRSCCYFSVFSFGDNGWANDSVLVG
ncbi:unnamed protein product [Calypogeia fissa]